MSIPALAIAVHECGHALAAIKAKLRIDKIALGRKAVPGKALSNLGSLEFDFHGKLQLSVDPETDILVSCGGPAAEFVFMNQKNSITLKGYFDSQGESTWGSDVENIIHAHVKLTSEKFAGDEERVKEVAFQYISNCINQISATEMNAIILLATKLLDDPGQSLYGPDVSEHFQCYCL